MKCSSLPVVLIPIFGFATHAQNIAPRPNLKPDRRLSAEMALPNPQPNPGAGQISTDLKAADRRATVTYLTAKLKKS